VPSGLVLVRLAAAAAEAPLKVDSWDMGGGYPSAVGSRIINHMTGFMLQFGFRELGVLEGVCLCVRVETSFSNVVFGPSAGRLCLGDKRACCVPTVNRTQDALTDLSVEIYYGSHSTTNSHPDVDALNP
jgi:hypothetical protein